MISKILVGFDGTKCSEKALDFCLDLAEKYSAEVLILNVLDLPAYSNPEDPLTISAGITGLIKDLRTSHEGILASGLSYAVKTKPKVQVHTDLREGDPATQIVAGCSRWKI